MIKLHKILETDVERIIRFCYAEDPELISSYKSGLGNDLDSCVASALNPINAETTFFKVETSTGAIVGYFAKAPVVDTDWALNGFVIRKAFRISYTPAFFDLISQSFENSFSSSIDAVNLVNQDNIKNNYTITNPAFFSNKYYLLLKTYKST